MAWEAHRLLCNWKHRLDFTLCNYPGAQGRNCDVLSCPILHDEPRNELPTITITLTRTHVQNKAGTGKSILTDEFGVSESIGELITILQSDAIGDIEKIEVIKKEVSANG